MTVADRAQPRRMLAVLFLAAMLSYTDRQILNILAEPIKAELGFSDVQIGLLQGLAFAGVYAVASLPIGRLADRTSRRLLLIGGIALWSLAMASAAFAHSFTMLFASRVLVGIGEAALAPAAISLLGDLFPAERRGMAISIYLLGQILGGGASVLVGGSLLQWFAGGDAPPGLTPWREVMLVLGSVGIVPIIGLASLREPARGGGTGHRVAPNTSFLAYLRRHRRLMVPIYAAMALISFGEYGALSWTPALLSRHFGWQPGEIARGMGVAALLGPVLGTIGGAAIAMALRRHGQARVKLMIALAGLVLGAPGAFLGLQTSGTMVVFMLALWVVGPTAALALILSVIPDIAPAELRGRATALATFLNTALGLGCAPLLVGAIGDGRIGPWRDLGVGITLCAATAAVAAAILLLVALRNVRSFEPAAGDPARSGEAQAVA